MLNLYEGAFKLVNSKLYESPYKCNVDKVWSVLKKFKLRCRLNFLINLSDLEIDVFDFEKSDDEELFRSGAFYDVEDNKIYLSEKYKNFSDEAINHELFHVASSKKNNYSGIMNEDYGFLLTEGITEYLCLKSNNLNFSLSGYQRELFVIELLVFIFGEKILEPYFMNDSEKFFYQFGMFKEYIVKIDKYLEEISFSEEIQRYRLYYLFLVDIAPDLFVPDIDVLRFLKLKAKTLYAIKKMLGKYNVKINQRLKEYEEKNTIDIINHNYNNKNIQMVYNEFCVEYKEIQDLRFGIILFYLIYMGISNNISMEVISDFIIEKLNLKDNYFRNLYGDLIVKNLRCRVKEK